MRNSRTSGCAALSIWRLISNGPTRICSTGSYERTASFFEASPLKADGPPPDDELAILEPMRGTLRQEVFSAPELPPVSDGSGQDRKLLRQASELLDQAGWASDNGLRKNAKGETLSAEFLIESPVFERILAPYVKNLKLLGVDASIRIIDDAQYQSRREAFDYDILSSRFSLRRDAGHRPSGFLWNVLPPMRREVSTSPVSKAPPSTR